MNSYKLLIMTSLSFYLYWTLASVSFNRLREFQLSEQRTRFLFHSSFRYCTVGQLSISELPCNKIQQEKQSVILIEFDKKLCFLEYCDCGKIYMN